MTKEEIEMLISDVIGIIDLDLWLKTYHGEQDDEMEARHPALKDIIAAHLMRSNRKSPPKRTCQFCGVSRNPLYECRNPRCYSRGEPS